MYTGRFSEKREKSGPLFLSNVPLVMNEDMSAEACNAALEVLAQMPFDKFSTPLSAYRADVDENPRNGDTRVITVGYIKSYDPESRTFEVAVYAGPKQEAIEAFDSKVIEVFFTVDRDNNFKSIIHLNIIDHDLSDEEGEEETDPAE